MATGFFITGTDTAVGKTWVSLALMAALQGHGHKVAGMKPVASGAEWVGGRLCNDDALLLQRHASVLLPYETVNPYAFAAPVSPHIAAAEAGVVVDLGRIAASYELLAREADVVLVEGVGGWLSPLSPVVTVADLAARLGLPVVLVVGLRLGCLNHALLTAHAIAQSGVPLAGWVANSVALPMARQAENVRYLRDHLNEPLLGVLPYQEGLDAAALGRQLDAAQLLAGS